MQWELPPVCSRVEFAPRLADADLEEENQLFVFNKELVPWKVRERTEIVSPDGLEFISALIRENVQKKVQMNIPSLTFEPVIQKKSNCF